MLSGSDRALLYLGGIDLPMPQARAVQTLHTAHGMASAGWQVLLAVGRAPRHGLAGVLAQYGLAPHRRLTIQPLPTLRLPPLPNQAFHFPRLAAWNWSYGLAALAACRRLPPARRPRLVLARDPRLAWLFLRLRPLTGAAVVYEVHELFSTNARFALDDPQAAKAHRARQPRIRRLEEEVFSGAAHLITLTEACRQIVVDEFGVPAERVFVASDAVASVPPSLPPRRAESRTMVYAGQLYPWKGVGTLVKALALLPDVRLRIVGGLSADDEHAQALRALAVDQGVLERIEFSGFLPHVRVAEAISGYAAAVVPLPDNPMSCYFTSPLKVYEYMATGLPIVASDLPAMREVLRDEQNALLVPPDDVSALARALARLLDRPGLAERLRAQAFTDVQGHTWAARAAAILREIEPGG